MSKNNQMMGPLLMFAIATAGACSRPDAPAAVDTSTSDQTPAPETTPSRAADTAYIITSSGIGAIRLGMTLDEARRALPTAALKRTSDGDGAALVEVTLAPDTTMVLWADEPDAEAPVDWTKRIDNIETFSAAFHTRDGVRPGSLVTDVEKILGKVTGVSLSEIESRQYVSFAMQPEYLTLRLDYTGVFREGSRKTTEVTPGAKILSIGVR